MKHAIKMLLRKSTSILKLEILKIVFGGQIKIGKACLIDINTHVQIHNNGQLLIGDNVLLRSNSKGYHAGMPFNTAILIDNDNAKIKIGNNVRINGAYVHAQKNCYR